MSLQALQDWARQYGLRALMDKDLTAETWLSEFNTPLAELPEAIGLMRALTKIDLRSNGLRRLPQSLGQLRRLEDLTSMDNELESLPDVFHHLKELHSLDMRGNLLRTLPPSLGELENLRLLNLRSNLLEELPAQVGKLKSLYWLEVSCNPLRALPPELRHCESLVYLDISGTLISHLPEWLGEMKNLKHLIRGPNRVAESDRAWAEHAQRPVKADSKRPYIAPPPIDNEPFKLWFERELAQDPYGPMKIAFRRLLEQDLTDAEIASKARTMVGDESWPEGWYVWGEDGQGEYIEYYLTSRWGDRHGRINRDGSHEALPELWQVGPIDEEYEALWAELRGKGLLDG